MYCTVKRESVCVIYIRVRQCAFIYSRERHFVFNIQNRQAFCVYYRVLRDILCEI